MIDDRASRRTTRDPDGTSPAPRLPSAAAARRGQRRPEGFGGEEPRAARRHRIGSAIPLLLLLGLLSGVAACGGGGWIEDHPEIADRARSRPEAFVMAAGERWDGLEAIAGSYRLEARRGLGRRSWDLWVVVERPDRVRLEVLDPTAATRALLVAGDAGVALYVVEDAVLYHSPQLEAFERALGLPLSLPEAIGVLLGYGVDPAHGAAEISWDEDRRRVRVTWPGRALQWLHPVRLVYDEMAFVRVPRGGGGGAGNEGEVEVAVAVELETEVEGIPIPRVVRLEVPSEGLRLRLERSSTSIDPDLDGDVFAVPEVPGARFLPMEELGREGGLLRRTGEAPGDSEARDGPGAAAPPGGPGAAAPPGDAADLREPGEE